MDLDQGLEQHIKWKTVLRRYIDAPTAAPLDAETIERSDRCELGRWILTEGARFSDNAEFQKLRETHAAFHQCAAEVVRRVQANDTSGAKELLGPESRFSTLSRLITQQLQKLKTLGLGR